MLLFVFSAKAQTVAPPTEVNGLLQKHTCYTCHKADKKMIGPSWQDIAKKGYDKKKFIGLVAKPVPANWPGYPPMAALPNVPKADLEKIYTWVSTLKK
ncbi:MAG: cytochrome C [Saprospiraceae bacterium]|nr:cytochrome C [Saprospiraceae bacterium]